MTKHHAKHQAIRLLAHSLCAGVVLLATLGCRPYGNGRNDVYIPPATQPPADLIIRDALVYTMNEEQPAAEAIAIRGGVIVSVGTLQDMQPLAGPDTTIISAPGGMVLPAFQDAHAHPYLAGLDQQNCSMLDDPPTAEAYVARARSCYAAMTDRTWITGAGWNPTAFGAGPLPHKSLLDRVVPDKPAVFFSSDGHTAWVNSLALAAAGITRDTPDPPNGRIDRDPKTGEASGSLQEAAMLQMQALLPAPTAEQRLAAMRYMQTHLHSLGVTAVQVGYASIDPDDPLRALESFRDFADRGELRLRTVLSLLWDRDRGLEQIDELDAARRRYSAGLIDAGTVKLFLDGVVEPHTAALIEEYADRPGYRGDLQIPPTMLREAAARLDARGFQLHMHVIGDRAVRAGLDAIEYSRELNPRSNGRHHLAHVQFIHPDDLPRFAALDVTANVSPIWAGGEDEFLTVLTLPRVGPLRYPWTYAFRDLLDAGARVAFGSDWNVTSANPLLAIESAVTRRNAEDPALPAFLPEQAMSLGEALRAATAAAAYVNRLDDRTGILAAGMLADIVVLDTNLFDVAPKRISEARVTHTVFAGELVYSRASGPAPPR
jgi:predicted amidohydrolase YtcJ